MVAGEHEVVAVGGEPEVLGERQRVLERRVRPHALDPADPVRLGDVVGVGHLRGVGGVGDHQLDLVALPVVEDQARRPGRIQPQQLGVDLLLGQALEPVLGRVVGADPEHDPLDVARARQARFEFLELEERDDAAGLPCSSA